MSNKRQDGRLNSIDDENTIISLLKENNFKIENEKIRGTEDFSIYCLSCNIIHDVNIKTSSFNTSDNACSAQVLARCFLKPEFLNELTNNKKNKVSPCISAIVEVYNNLDKYELNEKDDYWFLVCHKETKEIVINSIKNLNSVVPNGNNLPFQIKWKNNKTFCNRTIKEQFKYLVKQTYCSYKKIPYLELGNLNFG